MNVLYPKILQYKKAKKYYMCKQFVLQRVTFPNYKLQPFCVLGIWNTDMSGFWMVKNILSFINLLHLCEVAYMNNNNTL